MRLAIAQCHAAGRDVLRNIELAREIARTAAQQGAQILVFPEMWNIGYTLPTKDEDFRGYAVQAQDRYLDAMSSLAAEHRMAIVATYANPGEHGLYNAATILDASGSPVLTYRKVHLARFSGEDVLTPGTSFPVAQLSLFDGQEVTVGVLICYDRLFPEAMHCLALQGAELVLIPNAGRLCDNRLTQVQTRAFENQLAVAVANYPVPYGRSIVCDGVAFNPDRSVRDHALLRADAEPAVHTVDIDLEHLRHYRSRQPWGLQDRVPEAYVTC